MSLFTKLFGGNDREVKKYLPARRADQRARTRLRGALRRRACARRRPSSASRLADGETLDDLLPEAFAVVREAARRTGRPAPLRRAAHRRHRPPPGQDLRAEDRRGQDADRDAAALPQRARRQGRPPRHRQRLPRQARRAVVRARVRHARPDPRRAPARRGVPLLAREAVSDTENMEHLRPCSRREAYSADITYGTNHEFGFDYLRDNMAVSLDDCVQRELHYAIVDEVDNILIDEARTPLIISGPAEDSAAMYQTFARVAPRLTEDEDYTIDLKAARRAAHRGRRREAREAARHRQHLRARELPPHALHGSRAQGAASSTSATSTTSSRTARSSSSTTSPAA